MASLTNNLGIFGLAVLLLSASVSAGLLLESLHQIHQAAHNVHEAIHNAVRQTPPAPSTARPTVRLTSPTLAQRQTSGSPNISVVATTATAQTSNGCANATASEAPIVQRPTTDSSNISVVATTATVPSQNGSANGTSSEAPIVHLGAYKLVGVPSVGDAAPVGHTFHGIQYATAKRFEDSVENNGTHEYLNNATRDRRGPMCMQDKNQPPWTLTGIKEFAEDCLFLDVYTPPGFQQSAAPLPVFIWSWGGQMLATGRGFPGAGADFAKSLSAIVVIAQYRTGAFGFLSTGDTASRGNYALSDMKNVLRFVHRNIASFNGDPARITLAGQSDSAALVSALLLDRKYAPLVFTTITQSGSVLSPWAIDEDPLPKAVALAVEANCTTTPTSAMIECLKKVSDVDLEVAAERMFKKAPHAPGAPTWTMVIDGQHIPSEPATLLKSTDRRNITGSFVHQFNKNDAAIVDLRAFGVTNPAAGTVNLLYGEGLPKLPVLKGAIIPRVIQQATLCNYANISQATINLVAKTYGMVETADNKTLLQALYQLTTDVNHGLSSIKEAMLYEVSGAARASNVISVFSFDGNVSSYSPLTNGIPGLGAYHTVELGYLFAGTMTPLASNRNDTDVTLSLRLNYDLHLKYGLGLGGNFSTNEQNYVELGQDKIWTEKKFERAVQLVKFWDRLKELRCAAPSVDDSVLNVPAHPVESETTTVAAVAGGAAIPVSVE
ncbi:putative Bile salt-activated lipase [Hypsibius exemplaris]|uniref:Bile salt-activated lipase n=1 Tax=Hypsibius exemplaris TaxID=2072580 RepID=A0A9X6ND00_HYPEX|nr:putative Bile salt-activated lipase [Hypsibius exemplaris]